MTTNVFLYKKLSFDPAKSGRWPCWHLSEHAPGEERLPADGEGVHCLCEANPSKVNYASQGIGTTSHLTAELYNSLAGAKMVHVPIAAPHPPSTTLSPVTST
jgi:hypothetical protein